MDPLCLSAEPITTAAFAPYGEVIETDGQKHVLINEGKCKRFTDLATHAARPLSPEELVAKKCISEKSSRK